MGTWDYKRLTEDNSNMEELQALKCCTFAACVASRCEKENYATSEVWVLILWLTDTHCKCERGVNNHGCNKQVSTLS